MEYIELKAKQGKYEFLIKQDLPDIGWYLYVFENEVSLFDTLQDDLDTLKDIAFEDFNCPRDIWK